MPEAPRENANRLRTVAIQQAVDSLKLIETVPIQDQAIQALCAL